MKSKRQPCERFSRVVGYIRPVQQWNEGKQAEWGDRKMFKLNQAKAGETNSNCEKDVLCIAAKRAAEESKIAA